MEENEELWKGETRQKAREKAIAGGIEGLAIFTRLVQFRYAKI